MTPKEKADELFNKFYDQLPSTGRFNAVQCAIIAVEEILYEIKHGLRMDWIKERQGGEEYVIYWNEVLNELISMQ